MHANVKAAKKIIADTAAPELIAKIEEMETTGTGQWLWATADDDDSIIAEFCAFGINMECLLTVYRSGDFEVVSEVLA